MSNQELLSRIKEVAQEERRLGLEVLHLLCEVEVRKLFLELGYSSLFKYAVRELGYSEDEAYRRIAAMRLMKSVPGAEREIASGALNLTNAAQIQNYFRAEPGLSTQARAEFVAKMENKSVREVECEIIRRKPELAPNEKIRRVAEEKSELRVVIDEDLRKKLDRLRALLSHKNPNMTYQELLAHLVELGLEKLDPERQQARRLAREEKAAKVQRTVSGAPKVLEARVQTLEVGKQRRRYIPARLRAKVWARDQGQCTYTNPRTKNRCDSRHLLQIDHIQPFAMGGDHDESNLRLLCAAHNQWRAKDM